MFANLNQIDIVYQSETGEKVGVQTEHRTTEELAADEARSILFALSRILRPLASNQAPARIEVAFQHPPPARLRSAVEAAGASILVDMAVQARLQPPDDALVDSIAADCLESIGRALLAKHGLDPTAEGLAKLEQSLETDGFAEWKPELQHTAVLELGAAAGVVIRAMRGGKWARDTYFAQLFPFTIDVDDSRMNIFGRSDRFYSESTSDGPSVLLTTLGNKTKDDAAILPVMRLAGFGASKATRSVPLLEMDDPPATMPHIYLVEDRPQSVSYLNQDRQEDFEVLLEASLENLARIQISPEHLGGDLPIYVLEGSFYAAAKILDKRFLRDLAARLKTGALMVAVPSTQAALIAPIMPVAETIAFVELVQHIYRDETKESYRLSDAIFLATPANGIEGMVRLQPPPAEEKPPEPKEK